MAGDAGNGLYGDDGEELEEKEEVRGHRLRVIGLTPGESGGSKEC